MLSEELTIFAYQKISNNYLRESHPVKFINHFFFYRMTQMHNRKTKNVIKLLRC